MQTVLLPPANLPEHQTAIAQTQQAAHRLRPSCMPHLTWQPREQYWAVWQREQNLSSTLRLLQLLQAPTCQWGSLQLLT